MTTDETDTLNRLNHEMERIRIKSFKEGYQAATNAMFQLNAQMQMMGTEEEPKLKKT